MAYKASRRKIDDMGVAKIDGAPVAIPDNKKETDKIMAAKSFKKILSRTPVLCEDLGSNVYLHPISWVDGQVLDAISREVFGKLEKAVSEKVAKESFGRATMILNIQFSARRGEEKEAPLLFAVIDEAEDFFRGKFELLVKAFSLMHENFELTVAEKKI